MDSFLSRRDTLLCHVWESQAIGYWLKNISNLITFSDNKRLLHGETASENDVANRREICHSFLGIHKSYPPKMRSSWSIYEKEEKPIAYKVPLVSYKCEHPIAMDHMVWKNEKIWFSEPKLCKDNPVWGREGEYKGRELEGS